jgi:hypothetical protein
MADSDVVRLSLLLQELRNEGFAAPTYRAFFEAARDGLIPATQADNGLWYARRKDKHAIVAALGKMRRRGAPELTPAA